MNPLFPKQLAALLATILMVAGHAALAQSDSAQTLHSGHTDLGVGYDPVTSAWSFRVGQDGTGFEVDPDDAILAVDAISRTRVPAAAGFQFLGVPGDSLWLLPQAQREEILYLGFGGDDLPSDTFNENKVLVTLKSVFGPGDFYAYRLNAFGVPQVAFNTHDGIDSNDQVTVPVGGDNHLAWGFTAAGDYDITVEASGVLTTNNSPIASPPATFHFHVGPPVILTFGHTDLGLAYATNAGWNLHVGYDVTEEEFEPNSAILQVNAEAKTTVPSDPQFAFLGQAGMPIWILPQVQHEKLLYLGFGGEELPEGVFTNNQVNVRLLKVEGPGALFAYQVNGFGTPLVSYNSADGITPVDVATLAPGGDAHLNWAFSQPGRYIMTVQAEGSLLSNNQLSTSGPVQFEFLVIPPPVELVNEHVDIRANYESTADVPLSIIVRDEDHKRNLTADEARLIVQPNAQLTLPDGTPFGPAGASLWAIPQSQDTSLLYLGLSAEGLPPVFTAPIKFELKRLEGPGDFFVWQAGSTGGFDVKFNSQNGLDAKDVHFQILNSHEHFNWGFTKPGVYHAYFQATTTITGQTVQSRETPLVFEVRPVPPPVGFAAWQAAHFAEGSIQSVIGPAADLDHDGIPNIYEYAFGLDPYESSSNNLPTFVQTIVQGQPAGGLSYEHIKAATDLTYRVEASSDLKVWTELKTAPQITDLGERERVVVSDEEPLSQSVVRFYRLVIQFSPPSSP